MLMCSIFVSMPLYLMSLIRISSIACTRLKKKQVDILWRGVAIERKVHNVKWETVCLSKDKGF